MLRTSAAIVITHQLQGAAAVGWEITVMSGQGGLTTGDKAS